MFYVSDDRVILLRTPICVECNKLVFNISLYYHRRYIVDSYLEVRYECHNYRETSVIPVPDDMREYEFLIYIKCFPFSYYIRDITQFRNELLNNKERSVRKNTRAISFK
jgi:hypothetical protein